MDAEAREAARRRTLAQAAAFFAGGLAAPLVTLPLDVARTRLQGAARRATHAATRASAEAPHGAASDGVIMTQGGTFGTVARALAAEVRAAKSVRPLFRGLGPALAGSSLHFCVLMLLYEPLRDGARSRWQGLPRLVPDAVAGALAGAAAVVVTNPLWVLKTRAQTASSAAGALPAGGGGGRGGAELGARALVAREGARALLRGVAPALLLVSYNAMQLPLYHTLRTDLNVPTLPAVVASVTAASAATYPLQVVRTRLQGERRGAGGRSAMYASFRDVLRHVSTREAGGPRAALYRGFAPYLVRSVAGWYVRFATAELLAARFASQDAAAARAAAEEEEAA